MFLEGKIQHLINIPAIGVANVGGPNWNATNDKNVTKKTIVSSVSVSFSIFVYNSTYKRTTVINNNIDLGGPGPFNLIFANQLKWAPAIIFKWAPYNNIDLRARASSI